MPITPVFLDTNVFIYAAGAEHPMKAPSQEILRRVADHELAAITNAEVVQEILYVLSRRGLHDAASHVARNALSLFPDLLPVTSMDMLVACSLVEKYPGVPTRDAVHAATMLNHGISTVITADGHFDGLVEIRRLNLYEAIGV
jgi:hypothetical protein